MELKILPSTQVVSQEGLSVNEVEVALVRLPTIVVCSDRPKTKYFAKYVSMESFITRLVHYKHILALLFSTSKLLLLVIDIFGNSAGTVNLKKFLYAVHWWGNHCLHTW